MIDMEVWNVNKTSQRTKTTYKAPSLRTLREGAGMSQDALSKLAATGRVTISRIESGEGANGLTLNRLALALRVSRAELEADPDTIKASTVITSTRHVTDAVTSKASA